MRRPAGRAPASRTPGGGGASSVTARRSSDLEINEGPSEARGEDYCSAPFSGYAACYGNGGHGKWRARVWRTFRRSLLKKKGIVGNSGA